MRKRILFSILFGILMFFGMTLIMSDNAYAGTDAFKTFNDNNSNITYTGKVQSRNESGNYGSTYHGFYKGSIGASASFNFTGNKLQICGLKCGTYTKRAVVQIDGIDYDFYPYADSSHFQSVLFSKLDLSEGEHSAVIKNVQASTNPETYDFRIDAIKIDSDDMLLPYYPNQKNEVLKLSTNDAVTLNNDFKVDLYMDNVTGIGAETVVINYDTSKLKFLGVEQADGIRPVKVKCDNGKIELVLKSKTKGDYVNARKLLAKLKFKAIAGDCALIGVENGEISNCNNSIKTLTKAQCGHMYVLLSK